MLEVSNLHLLLPSQRQHEIIRQLGCSAYVVAHDSLFSMLFPLSAMTTCLSVRLTNCRLVRHSQHNSTDQ